MLTVTLSVLYEINYTETHRYQYVPEPTDLALATTAFSTLKSYTVNELVFKPVPLLLVFNILIMELI